MQVKRGGDNTRPFFYRMARWLGGLCSTNPKLLLFLQRKDLTQSPQRKTLKVTEEKTLRWLCGL